jgi:hypothetical protein
MCFIQTISIVVNMKGKPTNNNDDDDDDGNNNNNNNNTFISLQYFTSSKRYLLYVTSGNLEYKRQILV